MTALLFLLFGVFAPLPPAAPVPAPVFDVPEAYAAHSCRIWFRSLEVGEITHIELSDSRPPCEMPDAVLDVREF